MGNLRNFLAEIEKANGDRKKLMELAGTIENDELRRQMEESIVAAIMSTGLNLFTLKEAVDAFSGKTGVHLLLQAFAEANPINTLPETVIIINMVQCNKWGGKEAIEAILAASTWLTWPDLRKAMSKKTLTAEFVVDLAELGLDTEEFLTKLLMEEKCLCPSCQLRELTKTDPEKAARIKKEVLGPVAMNLAARLRAGEEVVLPDETSSFSSKTLDILQVAIDQKQNPKPSITETTKQKLTELSKTDPVRATVLWERMNSDPSNQKMSGFMDGATRECRAISINGDGEVSQGIQAMMEAFLDNGQR